MEHGRIGVEASSPTNPSSSKASQLTKSYILRLGPLHPFPALAAIGDEHLPKGEQYRSTKGQASSCEKTYPNIIVK